MATMLRTEARIAVSFPLGQEPEGSVDVDNRKFRRICPGPEFTLTFLYKDEPFSRLPLANLSEEGCFAILPGPVASQFEVGAPLEGLTLEHELMPHNAIEARVAFLLGSEDADREWTAGIGIQFTKLPEMVRRSLRDFVASIPELF